MVQDKTEAPETKESTNTQRKMQGWTANSSLKKDHSTYPKGIIENVAKGLC